METYDTTPRIPQAVLVGVHRDLPDSLNDCTDASMEELELLAQTAGAEVVAHFVQNRATPENATYIGEGKCEEIAAFCEANEIDIAIFDDELTPIQMRNLSDRLEVQVLDRSGLIMDIFASRARTGEGKLQVELAQLQYLLPRLTGSFVHLSRLGAGIGTRGPGETKLETDRRHIRRRIDTIRSELREVVKNREVQRRQRVKEGIQQVAVVGYTNAGKSTLLNTLTGAGVLAEDKLFATLDPTARKLTLPDGAQVVLVDTVGFIRKLPHHLIRAFHSTLEEAANADVLVHMIDGSDPEAPAHLTVAQELLAQLGAGDKPTILAVNKADIAPSSLLYGSSSLPISAKTGEGIDELLQRISELLPQKRYRVTVVLPFHRGDLTALLHREGSIESEEYTADGVRITVTVDEKTYAAVKEYREGGAS